MAFRKDANGELIDDEGKKILVHRKTQTDGDHLIYKLPTKELKITFPRCTKAEVEGFIDWFLARLSEGQPDIRKRHYLMSIGKFP